MKKEKKSNEFFLNLETHKKAKSSARKVFDENGVLITDPRKILQEIQNFYSKLLGDLISNKHELIIKRELRVLNLSLLDAFRLVSLIDALPTQWRESLKTCISTGDTPFNLRDEIKLRLSGQIVLLEKAYSKIVYKELRNRIVTPPTAKLKFDAHFVNDTLNWKKIYSLPYRVALDTKTREFQYKLLNHEMPCDKYLLMQNWYYTIFSVLLVW